MRFRRRSRIERKVGVLLAVLALIASIVLVREVVHSYYGPLVRTVQSPETAPLDTP